MDPPNYTSGVTREIRFAFVRCYGNTETDRIASVQSVVKSAVAHGATAEVIAETCILTYGAIFPAPDSATNMQALVHELCTGSRPASVIHGTQSCVVAFIGSDDRFALQSRIPKFREFMSQLDDLLPGDVRAV